MAQYPIKHSCGHTETKQLYGSGKDRQRKIEWLEGDGLCSVCYKAKKEAERQTENKQAAIAAREQGLPTLTGSPKQVTWAETIRQKKIEYLDKLQNGMKNNIQGRTLTEEEKEAVADIIHRDALVREQTVSGWWIDNQYKQAKELLRDIDPNHTSLAFGTRS